MKGWGAHVDLLVRGAHVDLLVRVALVDLWVRGALKVQDNCVTTNNEDFTEHSPFE